MSQTVFITQHAPYEHPAFLKRALDSQFISNSIIKTFENFEFPSLKNIFGLISLGGPMSANDDKIEPWILKEIKLMQDCYQNEIPIVGICLGGQMLARALGGKVIQNPHPEIGWYPIDLLHPAKNDPFFSQLTEPSHFYQWHYDSFHPPKNAKILAKSSLCEHQAFSLNEKTYGFQFHPEVDHELILEWLSIEGTDDEILHAKMAHHHECVQEPKLHIEKAKLHEKNSILLLTMMTSIFNPHPFIKSSQASLQLKENPQKNSIITLKDLGSEKSFSLFGKMIFSSNLNQGNFIFFRENSGLLWPIREDYIYSTEFV